MLLIIKACDFCLIVILGNLKLIFITHISRILTAGSISELMTDFVIFARKIFDFYLKIFNFCAKSPIFMRICQSGIFHQWCSCENYRTWNACFIPKKSNGPQIALAPGILIILAVTVNWRSACAWAWPWWPWFTSWHWSDDRKYLLS